MRWTAVIVLLLIALYIGYCDPPWATRLDNQLYDSFTESVPAPFKGALIVSQWRGFDFTRRLDTMSLQCGWRVYDLRGMPLGGFRAEVETTQQTWRAPTHLIIGDWTTRAYAMTPSTPMADDVTRKAEFQVINEQHEFCGAPKEDLRLVIEGIKRAWRDGRSPFRYLDDCIGCGVLGIAVNHMTEIAIIDVEEQKLFMLFIAQPQG